MNMTFWKVLIAAVFVNISTEANAKNRSAPCLPELDQDSERFTPCLSVPCLLFKNSAPFIAFGAQPHPPFGRPFRCSSRRTEYENLHGISFDILDEISELQNAYCIALPEECTYDDLIHTLDDMVPRKWIGLVIDFMALAPYRLTNTTTSSVPYLHGTKIVYGLRKNAQVGWKEGLGIVPSIYELRAWILIFVWFLVLFILRVSIIWTFLPHKLIRGTRMRTFFRYLVFAYHEHKSCNEESAETDNQSEEDTGFEYWDGVWCSLWISSSVIVIMLVEISIAVKIFNRNWNKLDMPLHNMPVPRLQQFIAVNQTASKFLFEALADPNGRFSTSNPPPWQLCANHTDCIAKIRDPDNSAQFGITYDFYHRYWLRSDDGCDEFAVFQVRTKQPFYNAVWYYNKSVPGILQLAINRRLTNLNVRSRILKMVAAGSGEDVCNDTPNAISWQVLVGLLMLVAPGVLFLILGLFRTRWFQTVLFRRNQD